MYIYKIYICRGKLGQCLPEQHTCAQQQQTCTKPWRLQAQRDMLLHHARLGSTIVITESPTLICFDLGIHQYTSHTQKSRAHTL